MLTCWRLLLVCALGCQTSCAARPVGQITDVSVSGDGAISFRIKPLTEGLCVARRNLGPNARGAVAKVLKNDGSEAKVLFVDYATKDSTAVVPIPPGGLHWVTAIDEHYVVGRGTKYYFSLIVPLLDCNRWKAKPTIAYIDSRYIDAYGTDRAAALGVHFVQSESRPFILRH